MKRHLLAPGVIALAIVTGWGVYSVRMDPPPRVRPGAPFDLSVGLGGVRTIVDGRVIETTPEMLAALDADFVESARASNLFRQAVPRGGGPADILIDVDRTQTTPPAGIGRTAYLVFASPLPLVAPGVPFPWDYRIGRHVIVRGLLERTSFELAERSATYDQRVCGSTYWGGRSVDPLRESEGEYVLAPVSDALSTRRDAFEAFASAVHTGDVESAHLLSLQAGATEIH